MCIEGVQNIKGGIRCDFDCALASCCKEVKIGGRGRGNVVGEGGCVGLDGLGVGVECRVGCSAFS